MTTEPLRRARAEPGRTPSGEPPESAPAPGRVAPRGFAALGIDVGSVNVKVCALDGPGRVKHAVVPHDGDIETALEQALAAA